MNVRINNHKFFFYLLFVVLVLSNCKKDENKPVGFSADFNTSFTNGGMVPDSVVFSAAYADAENYNWNVSGVNLSGKNIGVNISAAGDYVVQLTASSGSYSEMETSFFTLKNYPPNGTSASFLNANGEIITVVLNANQPSALPIDSIVNTQMSGGMDYDDDDNKLYYTGSIIRANPNGTNKETILFTDPPGEFIRDLVVDSQEDMIYYSLAIDQQFLDKVWKMPIVGGVPEFLFEFQPSIDHLALNDSEDIVFAVSDADSEIIFYTPNIGLDAYSSFEGDKHALVWNNTESMLYFVEDINNDNTYDIVKSDPTLPNPSSEIVVNNASTLPILGMDIDEKNQMLYWTDQVEGAIIQLELNTPGASPKIVFLGISNPRSLAIGTFGE